MSIPKYGKIVALQEKNGRFTNGMFDHVLVVQEKIDGSQVSFSLVDGKVIVASRNAIVESADNKQFRMVYEWANANWPILKPGYVYRGEAVTTTKHNTLCYERIPANGVILFDIYDLANNQMLSPDKVAQEAALLELECVPTLKVAAPGELSASKIKEMLGRESILGGCAMEGVVIKCYDMPDPNSTDIDSANNYLKVKVVSEAFKEVHGKDWKARNPNTNDTVANLIAMYGTEARAAKAVQHLRDEGKLTDTTSDIGALIGEMASDITEECKDEILEALWKQYGKKIVQGAAHMMPDYYKRVELGLVG